ncbi:MAG: hypothetical protein AMJ43_02140 [Coxiella sp. DG_40]|nr:MAG: hypothetical protein AMJ43_02140 [Coxiella sp. DG_40]
MKVHTTDLYNNFKDGDLLFGRQNIREKFIKVLQNKFQSICQYCAELKVQLEEQKENVYHQPTISERLKPTITMSSTEEHPVTVDAFNKAIKPLLGNGQLTPLPNTKYHNFKAIQEHYQQVYLQLMPQYFTNLDNHKTVKACEAAVFKPNTRIHFIIDNQLIDAALGYTVRENYFKGFTAKELRFVYKHWDELKIMQNIVFYNQDGQKIHAPWKDANSHRFQDWPKKDPNQTKKVFAEVSQTFFARQQASRITHTANIPNRLGKRKLEFKDTDVGTESDKHYKIDTSPPNP